MGLAQPIRAPIRGPMLGISEAAARLRLKPKTIHNLISRGKLGAFRGRPVQIPESEIERILAARWQPPIL